MMPDMQGGPSYQGERDLMPEGMAGMPMAPNARATTTVDWSRVEEVPEDARIATKPQTLIDPKKLEAYVRERVRIGMAKYRDRWREYRLNRDCYTGDLGRALSESRHRPDTEVPWKQDYSPNIARTRALQHKHLTLAHNWSASFEAASEDLTDEWVAEAAASIAEYQDRHYDPKVLRNDAMEAAIVGAMAWGKLRENPTAGPVIGFGPDGSPLHEVMVEPEVLPSHRVVADVDAEEFSGSDGLAKARWVFHTYDLSRDELEQRLRSDELARVRRSERARGEQESGEQTDDLARLQDPMGGISRAASGGDEPREHYEVVEFFQRRSPRFPAGLFAKLVNATLVDGGAAPFADRDPTGELDLPFVLFNPYRVKGQFPGVALMSLLRGPQDALRKVESRNLERFVIGATKIIARNCGEIAGEWTDQDGQFIEMTGGGGDITVVKGQTPQPGDYVIGDRAIGHMDQLTGAYPTARGEGGDSKTAREAQLLRDAAEMVTGEVVEALNSFMRAMRKKEFILIKTAYSWPRLVEIKGQDDVVTSKVFQGADLEGLTDYHVVSDQLLPAGRAAKLASMQGFVELGKAIGEPIFSAKEIRQLLGVKKGLMPDDQRIRQRARRAAMAMLDTGQPRAVHPRERHEVWIEVMQDILESGAYDNAKAQMFGRLVFDTHLEERYARVEAAALQMMAAAQAMEGGAPPGQGAGAAKPKPRAPAQLNEGLAPIENAA